MNRESLEEDWTQFEEGDYAVLKADDSQVRANKCHANSFRVSGQAKSILHSECKGFYKADSDFFSYFLEEYDN